jgi:pimeloyl-ACP methyl ester carboxylesterase
MVESVFMQFFHSHGVQLAFVDLIPEPITGGTIFLIHGFASSHRINWVDTSWIKYLLDAGFRVVALDNRGHGKSEKLYEPEAYTPMIMAKDVIALMDHLNIQRADIMGYSMARGLPPFSPATILNAFGRRCWAGLVFISLREMACRPVLLKPLKRLL